MHQCRCCIFLLSVAPDLKSFLGTRGQKIACLNIRSLYANHSQIEADFSGTKTFALCLTETWLKPNIKSHIVDIPGFDLIRLDRLSSKRGGGVACFINQGLNWTTPTQTIDVSNSDIEILTVIINRDHQNPLYISTIYLPPTACFEKSLETLEEIAAYILNIKADWVLCGDMNVDLSSTNLNKSKKALSYFSNSNQLNQLINQPTRTTPNSSTLIDHIYTNLDYNHTYSGTIKYGVSDHDLIYIIIKKHPSHTPKETFTCHSLSRYTIENLNIEFINTDWTSFDNMLDVNTGWHLLHNIYQHALDRVAPFVTMNNVKQRKSWTSPELMSLIRERDHKKLMADKLLNNNSNKEFKKLRNKVKRTVIKTKRSFVLSKLNDSTNNPRNYWKELNNLFSPSPITRTSELILSDNGMDVDIQQSADFMNTYFSKVGEKLAEAINTNNENYLAELQSEADMQNNLLISWRPTNTQEIEIMIDAIDVNKSSMTENINSRLLKDCLYLTMDKICILFNRILTDGIFPTPWKTACVVPIFKNGNSKIVSNYRPISLLPLISKLFEKILHKRLYHFLNDKNFFSPNQCGFRPELGTDDSISAMLNYIYHNLNNQTPTMAIFFDLSKAFDSIDHSILKLKLKTAGIKGNCYKLLNNYLTNRNQYCRVNNTISNYLPIKYGVPQGSTLGPLLFIIFINDLATKITIPQISLYADDTAFYLSGKNPQKLSRELTESATYFQNWCEMNRLTLNHKKCKSLLFATKRQYKTLNPQISTRIGNTKIDQVSEFKYLGTIIDHSLNFESHIKSLRQKITSRMYTLRKIRWTLRTKDALTLYRSSILPYFDQGLLYYHSANVGTLKGLQSLQNKSLRIIYTKRDWLGTENAHKISKLLTIKERYKLALLKHAHRKSFKKDNLKVPRDIRLRSSSKIYLKTDIPKNAIYERSFVHRSNSLWNTLSDEIKSIKHMKPFKTRTKAELLLGNINFPE